MIIPTKKYEKNANFSNLLLYKAKILVYNGRVYLKGGCNMDSSTLQIFLAMAGYMLIVIGIGVFYAKRSNNSSEDFFLGGRTLGPWVAAMSAEA